MKNFRWVWPAVLLWLAAGCCAHPGLFDRVQRSLTLVQTYYGPLLEEVWRPDEKVRRAVVAADATLLLAGELQRQWCPDSRQTQQLELLAQEAKKMAQEAGVPAAGMSDKAGE